MRTPLTVGSSQLPSPASGTLPGWGPFSSAPPLGATGDRADCRQVASLRDGFARIGLRCEIDPAHDSACRVDLSLSGLPGLRMAAGRLYGRRSRRTRTLLDTDADDTALIVNIKGRHLIEQRGREMELGEGDGVLLTWTEPSRLTHLPPGEALALRFPSAGLASLLQRPGGCSMRMIPRGTQALGLLTRYVSLAWDCRTQAGPELQQLMVSHVYDLLAALLGPPRDAGQTPGGGGIHAAQLSAIKADIEESLDRPDLCVTALAGRHACTPRHVQRLFEADGTTFTAYVLSRRLARAYALLSDRRQVAEKISTIAYTCGFGDVSYFNRVFRRHHGLSPSDVRAEARVQMRLVGIGPEAAAIDDDKPARKRRI